ncbi:hypothetical protein Taro_013462 [Colocasia esculenta]|uniref:Uncharacterized protein n=1 Tax=Colocasia esculenta TaxID=4460 RepID=A0A843UG03_COLES|nr:hypothetical protein [Colocasia esculenta]
MQKPQPLQLARRWEFAGCAGVPRGGNLPSCRRVKEGIARAPHLLCHHGARVVIVDIQDDKGKALYHKLCRLTIAIFVYCNVSDEFNAKKEDFERVVAFNLMRVFLVTKHAACIMVPVGRGSIIIIASICKVIGRMALYSFTSTKQVVVGLCKEVELG